MQTKPRFPSRRFFGQSMQTSMQVLMLQRETQDRLLDEVGYTGRRVLGYKLPAWQRPEVWTVEQCVRFIESVWMGGDRPLFGHFLSSGR